MDILTPEEQHRQVAALNHEIFQLSTQLSIRDEIIRDQEYLLNSKPVIDPLDPFENPTEYKNYRGDYSEIQPRIAEPGYKLPLEPDRTERRNLRKYYSISGWMILLHFAFSLGATVLMQMLIIAVLRTGIPGLTVSEATRYMQSSSIYAGMNMLICMFCNVTFALFALKLGKVGSSELLKTRDFGLGNAFQYCTITMLISFVSSFINIIAQDVLGKYGLSSNFDMQTSGMSPLGVALTIIYACIIAPITEELLFRGALLKLLSKANQRFAVVASAIFFGLFHMNIQQFIFTFLFGLLLAHITLKHNSIIPCILVHMFNNVLATVSTTCLPYISRLTGLTSAELNEITTLILLVGASLGVMMLLTFTGRDRIPATTPQQSRRGLHIALTSFPFCVASAAAIGLTIANIVK